MHCSNCALLEAELAKEKEDHAKTAKRYVDSMAVEGSLEKQLGALHAERAKGFDTECVVCNRPMCINGPPGEYMCEPCAVLAVETQRSGQGDAVRIAIVDADHPDHVRTSCSKCGSVLIVDPKADLVDCPKCSAKCGVTRVANA